MSSSSPPSTGWPFEVQDPVELAFDQDELSAGNAQIQVSTSPIRLSDGLGLTFHSDEQFPAPDVTPNHGINPMPANQEEVQRRRINQHIYELLQAEDKRRERQKRVRFEDMGASPRKRARLASRLEELLHDETEVPDLSAGSDLLKLQMIALGSHEQEKERLLSIIEGLEKEIKRLIHLNMQQTERRMWIVREVLQGRATDLRKHSEFLMSLAEQEFD